MTPFVDLDDGMPGKTFVKEILVDDYRLHEMSDGSYLVFKDVDEEACYEIDSQFGCNCPAATYRAKTCKHERFAGFSRGTEDMSDGAALGTANGSSDDSELNQLEDLLE